MNPDLQKEIFTRLDALAAKLGTTAAQLWELLVRQAKIEAYRDLGLCVILVGFIVFSLYIAKVFDKRYVALEEADKNYNSDGIWAGRIIPRVAAAILTFVMLNFLYDVPTRLLNPGYYALEHILSTIGK